MRPHGGVVFLWAHWGSRPPCLLRVRTALGQLWECPCYCPRSRCVNVCVCLCVYLARVPHAHGGLLAGCGGDGCTPGNAPEAPQPSLVLRGTPSHSKTKPWRPIQDSIAAPRTQDCRLVPRRLPLPSAAWLPPMLATKGSQHRIPSGPGIWSHVTSLAVGRLPSCSPSVPHHSENAIAPGDQGPQHSSHMQLVPCPRGRPERGPSSSEPLGRDPSWPLALCRGPRGYLTPHGA